MTAITLSGPITEITIPLQPRPPARTGRGRSKFLLDTFLFCLPSFLHPSRYFPTLRSRKPVRPNVPLFTLTVDLINRIQTAYASIMKNHDRGGRGLGITNEQIASLVALSQRILAPPSTTFIERVGDATTIRPLIVDGPKRACYALLNTTSDPVIGRGHFNAVLGAIGLHNGELYVARQCHIASMADTFKITKEQARELLHKEANIVAKLNGSPNIVPIRTVCETPETFYSIHPYCPKGDLSDQIVFLREHPVQQREKLTPITERVQIMRSLLAALVTMHERHVLHRDIKPENVLLTDSGPLINDFGLAIQDDDESPFGIRWDMGDKYYSPPECVEKPCPPYTVKGDVWAMGVTLYSWITLSYLPWQYNSVDASIPKDWTLEFPYDWPMREHRALQLNLEELLASMLQIDPTRRINAHEALSQCDAMMVRAGIRAIPETFPVPQNAPTPLHLALS